MVSVTRMILMCICGLLLASVTYATFRNSRVITENTYTSVAVFPSSVLSSVTPGPAGVQPGDVVINEINWAGNNNQSTDEWIELRNMTAGTISLAGWTIDNLGSGTGAASIITIPSGHTILPSGLFLISRLAQSESRMSAPPDWVTSSISLSNAGEQLRLKTATGLLIDTANSLSGTWVGGSATIPRRSMERKLIPGDGVVASSWQTATTHTGMDGNLSTDEYGTPGNQNGL